MAVLQYIFLLLLFLIFVFYYNNSIMQGTVSLIFPNFLALGIALYLLLPLLEVIVKGETSNYNINFLDDAVIVMVSLLIGTYLGSVKWNRKDVRVVQNKSFSFYKLPDNSPGYEWTIVMLSSLLCAFLFHINVIVNKGGWYNYFTSGYGAMAGKEDNTIIGFTVYSTIAYALIFNNDDFIQSKTIRRIAGAFSVIISILLILGGNRNLAIMNLMAFIWAVFRKKKIKIYLVVSLLALGFVGLGFVAIGREYGLINFLSGNVKLNMRDVLGYVLSFQNGELGTTMKFSYYSEFINEGFVFPHKFGYSYTIGALTNLVPKAILPGRELAIADLFSRFGYSKYDGFGIGFSPIFEAKINFGYLWWSVFILIGYAVKRLTVKVKSSNAGKYKFYLLQGVIASEIFNLFRIDFATFFKFFSMIYVFAFLFLWLLCRCSVSVTYRNNITVLNRNYINIREKVS